MGISWAPARMIVIDPHEMGLESLYKKGDVVEVDNLRILSGGHLTKSWIGKAIVFETSKENRDRGFAVTT